MRKTAATSDRQRTCKPLFHRHSRPADTTHRAPDRLCKQEVTGSIPVGSIGRNTCKSDGFARLVVPRWYPGWAEGTADGYHIGPYFAGDFGFGCLQAGGWWFDPSWMGETARRANHALVVAPAVGVS
jgi:hypothetical protein